MNSLEAKIMADARSGHNCIRCQAQDGTVCGRHYNGLRQHLYGKCRGIKAHPFLVADFCNRCDREFIEGGVPKNDYQLQTERSEEFQHWCIMSLIRREKNGIIG